MVGGPQATWQVDSSLKMSGKPEVSELTADGLLGNHLSIWVNHDLPGVQESPEILAF